VHEKLSIVSAPQFIYIATDQILRFFSRVEATREHCKHAYVCRRLLVGTKWPRNKNKNTNKNKY
jgi:hypothetical protein